MTQRLALSGRFGVGKDWVAQQCGYQIESFALPIYKLTENLFGTADKTLPDIRAFMQYLGQIGWGYHDTGKFQYTPERASLVGYIRRHGSRITGFPEYDWYRFGLIRTFWVDGLIRRVKRNDGPIAVTNVRFEHELEPLKAAGFEHYLVACTDETRAARYGRPIPPHLDLDPSERMAAELEKTMPPERIIWNDHLPSPVSGMLSVEEFKQLACGDTNEV